MKRLVIIDGNSLVNRAFYALPLLATTSGKIYNAVYGFCNILIKLITEENPEYMVVAFDAARKTFRNEMYAEYKGTRKGMPEELAAQMPALKELLKKMNIKIIEQVGIEADDIIGTLSRKFDDVKSIIVTGDRDSLQLIDEKTEVWLTKHGLSQILALNERQLQEEFGLNPGQIVDLKSLMGDASDNIPGVKGIGEKTAMSLLQEFGTMQNVYANIDKISGKTQEKLLEGKEMAELSFKLATILTDCDIDCKLEDCTYDFPFSNAVKQAFVEYEFRSLTKREELFGHAQVSNANKKENTSIDAKQLKTLLGQKFEKIGLHIKDNQLYFAINTNESFVIPFDKQVANLFAEVLQNNKVLKIFYDKKAMLHCFDKFDIKIENAVDVSLGIYLINSNLKESDPQYTLDYIGLNGTTIGASLLNAWDYLNKELPAHNLKTLYDTIELPLVDVLYSMECLGISVDKKVLDELRPMYADEAKRLEQQIYALSGCEFNLASPKQLAEILFDKLHLSDYDNKKHATSVEKLLLIANTHPIVDLILRWRKIAKIVSTYIDGMQVWIKEDNKIHTTFNQALTVTGRLSSTEPNLQNLPIRSDEGKELRKMFVPSNKNNVLLSADYSQIELRLLAHYSRDPILCNAYKKELDIHAITASQIFDEPQESVTPLQRRLAKAVNFGIIYGISPFGLARNLGISQKVAKEYIDKYFEMYPTIKAYLDNSITTAQKQGYVTTMFGRIRNLDLNEGNRQTLAFNERAAMNMPLQGTASDIIKLAMINIFNKLKEKHLNTKMLLQIHDELIFDVPKEELPVVLKLVKYEMENVVKLNVPLTVSISYGENLYECK
ncbi:MAG: DNA polymerase I [Clostridia bacterium]|nr:DNA polymerase I [Clostridia bacterium]